MIYFLATRRNTKPIANFLLSRGKHFTGRFVIIQYENLDRLRSLKSGSFIFSDIDFLLPKQRQVAREIFAQLKQRYPHLKLFNDPARVLLRSDLLKRMHETGVNAFNVARASEAWDHLKYPVFIREADRHTGPLTPLLHTADEINHRLRLLKVLGYSLDELLIIEFIDASSEGVFNKMSGFVLGDTVMPRYLNFSPNWVVKSTVHPNDELMLLHQGDVENYMRTNPHHDWLQNIFREANITYGRADYALVNGALQLWEINLNPTFVRPPRSIKKDPAQQRFMRDIFYEQFYKSLEAIDYNDDQMVTLSIPDAYVSVMRPAWLTRLKMYYHARLHKKRKRYQLMRKISYSYARLRLWLADLSS